MPGKLVVGLKRMTAHVLLALHDRYGIRALPHLPTYVLVNVDPVTVLRKGLIINQESSTPTNVVYNLPLQKEII